jgi:tetratricopeptide (TPR) repeat protein
MALINKAATLAELERREEAVAIYEEVVERLGEASDPALREFGAVALIDKAITLVELRQREEAITICEQC